MVDKLDAGRIEMPEDDSAEPRCAVVLLLDTFYSMNGNPIAQLNDGLRQFVQELTADSLAARRCEVAIVTFGGQVDVLQEFTVASQLSEVSPLTASGDTLMGAAINRAVDLITAKKTEYRNTGREQYRPWIFMITDGQPTDDYSAAKTRVHQGYEKKSFLFYSVGCLNADMGQLTAIAPPSTPPLYLQGVKFKELFRWLSNSLRAVSGSKVGEHVAMPARNDWEAAPTA